MNYGKIYSYKNKKEAKHLIGKKVIACDNLAVISERPNDCSERVLTEVEENSIEFPFTLSHVGYQFIREIIKDSKIMTKRQLSEWAARGNGQIKFEPGSVMFVTLTYSEDEENEELPKCVFIRSWNSNEWVEPTVDIYERDCK